MLKSTKDEIRVFSWLVFEKGKALELEEKFPNRKNIITKMRGKNKHLLFRKWSINSHD